VEKPSIQQLFETYLFECEYSKKLRPATLKGYRDVFTLLTKLNPNIQLGDIHPELILQFFKTLEQRQRIVGRGTLTTGIKKSTVASYWSKLQGFFTWLEANRYITESPFVRLTYPTPTYEDKKFLSKDQVEKLIAAVMRSADSSLLLKRNLALFYVYLFCGLRREEALSLQIRDLNFERRLLFVRKETTKSGRSRTVPIHRLLTVHLQDYLKERSKFTSQYLFISRRGDHKLSLDGLAHLVMKLRQLSGVRFHLHQLRHTFAVNFLKSSNNIAKLQQLMGHKSVLVTLQYLRCLPPSEMRRDIEALSVDQFL
jgi:integrase